MKRSPDCQWNAAVCPVESTIYRSKNAVGKTDFIPGFHHNILDANYLFSYLCISDKMMSAKTVLFFVFFLSFLVPAVYAQTPADTGKIEIVQDARIKDLMEKQVEINSKASIRGYRIKIHFGADKAKAKEAKAKFIARFPDVPAYEKYDQPNFNIRVGDFRTRLEAYRFLKEVQPEFPTSFIVQDEIELPALDMPDDKK